MTRREIRPIILGMLGGIAATSVAFMVWTRLPEDQLVHHDQSIRELPIEPASTGATADVAVQLTPGEQQQIGVQTTEVRRETVTEEIQAVGRVEEARDGNPHDQRADRRPYRPIACELHWSIRSNRAAYCRDLQSGGGNCSRRIQAGD